MGKRWPSNAEAMRLNTIQSAQDARGLLKKAKEEVKRNPDLARSYISDAETVMADIEKWMIQAKSEC